VVGAFVAFGFWWKANIQPDSSDHPASQPDEPAQPPDNGPGPAPVEDGPTTPGQPGVAASDVDGRLAPAAGGPVSDENRRLQGMLASSDDNARREALLALGKLDDTDPKLLTDVLADDPAPDIRAAAARGLSRLRSQQAIPQLFHALSDEDLQVRIWAITALNKTCGGKFVFTPEAPLEERQTDLANIRTRLTYWGVLGENTDAEGSR